MKCNILKKMKQSKQKNRDSHNMPHKLHRSMNLEKIKGEEENQKVHKKSNLYRLRNKF